MPDTSHTLLREQLLERRQRLESVIAGTKEHTHFKQLLNEVDSALERMNDGTYGICEFCHDPVEKERLLADPLVRYCLDHLTPEERRALEQDLELAARIQRGLLPKQELNFGGWEIYYHYESAGPVTGDYCDVVTQESDDGMLFFALGDVSGKGVAASMLMTHLRAIFRLLVSRRLPLPQQMEQANRLFAESATSSQFATLVWGQASRTGEIEISNAGHCPPLLVRDGQVIGIEATGLPLGVFSHGQYAAKKLQLAKGDTLLLYTDGLAEAVGRENEEYGAARLSQIAAHSSALAPQALVRTCLEDLAAFRSGAPMRDDLSVMAIHRAG